MCVLLVLLAGPGASAAAPAPRSAAGPKMVSIQPGSFLMGSEAAEPGSERDEKRRLIHLTGHYLMAATEITRAQWRAVMGTDPAYFPPCDDCPVENISWFDAVEFCNALSVQQGLTPAYDLAGGGVTWRKAASGFRLPTEAEWEYACRAGTTTGFNFGPCLDTGQANCNGYDPLPGCPEGMNRAEPLEVGSFDPNAWGLYDMHGNVSEWCWDWYEVDPAGPTTDPWGPARGRLHVIRGGSWSSSGAWCRSAYRQCNAPDHRSGMTGLRPVRSPAPGEPQP